MKKILKRDFFNRNTTIVARELLGKFLVRRIHGKEVSGMITETEAYDGLCDLASHAAKGKTTRTEVMFGNPGFFYVYFCYGMHYMLNIVTREHGYPAAILIRSIILKDVAHINGPGKLTKCLQIDQSLNGKIANTSTNLWFEDRGIVIPTSKIKKLPRVGVKYAGPIWSSKKLRFTLTVHP